MADSKQSHQNNQQSHSKKEDGSSSGENTDPAGMDMAQSLFESLLQGLAARSHNACNRGLLPMDLHILTMFCEAFSVPPLNPEVTTSILQNEYQELLRQLERQEESSSPSTDNVDPTNRRVAALLRFASYTQPWRQQPPAPSTAEERDPSSSNKMTPSTLVELAVALDQWHAAERICDSTLHLEDDTTTPVDNAAILTLVQCALQSKRYRQADDYATRYFKKGGSNYVDPSLLVQVRVLHSKSTIVKLVQKRQYQIMERQVARVDQALDMAAEESKTATTNNNYINDNNTDADIREEIRTYALEHLMMSGHVEGAQRLGQLWGRSTDFLDPQELARARQERQRLYLQWLDVLPHHEIPSLLSTPEELRQAFALVEQQTPTTADAPVVWGFDAEWDGEDSTNDSKTNHGVSLFQLATTQGGALLIDIPALSRSTQGQAALADTVGRLFAGGGDSKVIMVGFGCKQDLSRLRKSASYVPEDDLVGGATQPHESWLKHGTGAVVDLTSLVAQRMHERAMAQEDSQTLLLKKDTAWGLSRVCHDFMGKQLDKSEQCSAWSTRPLSEEQRVYAALDAYICAAVYEKIMDKATE